MSTFRALQWAFLFFLSIAAAPSVFASDFCDSTVVDEADLFKEDPQIATAVTELERIGATVRFRTIKDYGAKGTLEAHLKGVREKCPSWQDLEGGWKSSLVIIAIEMKHRQNGIFYGDSWKQALGNGKADRIRADVMPPRLRDGNFVGAFVASAEAIGSEIDTYLHPQVRQSTPVVITREPTDFSGLWTAITWLVGITGFLMIGYLLYRLYETKRVQREKLRAARLDAQTIKSTCAQMILNVDLTTLKTKAAKADRSFGGESKLSETVAELEQKHGAITGMFATLNDTGVNDPDVDGLSVNEYERIASNYHSLFAEYQQLAEGVRRLEQNIAEVNMLEHSYARLSEDAESAQQCASEAIEKVAAEGFVVTMCRKTFDNATALLTEAVGLHEHGTHALATKKLSDACLLFESSETCAHALPKKKAAIEQSLLELNVTIETLTKHLPELRGLFSEIEKYNPNSWSAVRDNGSAAEKQVALARESVKEAAEAASMEKQAWDDAQECVKHAKQSTREALLLIDATRSMCNELRSAMEKAPREIELALADIEKAKAFVDAYVNTIAEGPLYMALRDATDCITQAKAMYAGEQPDYIYVVKEALRANALADSILERALSEHEATVRQQRMFLSLMEEVTRSIHTTEQYIRSHSDVEEDAKSLLKKAKSLKEKAQSGARNSEDCRDAIAYAQQADTAADNALKKAKSDVEEAEEAREARRRRSYSSGSSGGGSFGGGFGGSRGSIGGSSGSFGGGGGLGGSSGNW